MATTANKNTPAAKSAAKSKAAKSSSTTAKSTFAAKKSTSTSKSASGQVKAKSSAAEELRELLVDGLKDIYWAEKALVKALPKMSKNSTSQELAATIDEHLAVTKNQVTRLEQVFASMGEKAQAKKCDAMDGLIKEADSILEESEPGATRDAGIIAASQKVEHYEIATYGTLAAWAKTLGEDEAMKLLVATLNEEKEADALLTERAYHSINFDAVDASKM